LISSTTTRRILRALALVALLLVVVAPAFAAEGAEHAGGEHAKETFLGLPYELYWTVNLILFLGLLGWVAGPALVRFLEDKQEAIAHELAEADRQRGEVASVEQRLAAKIAELEAEIQEVSVRAEREGQRERVEIAAESEREAVRIAASARAEIAQGLEQARQQLTAHAARLAAGLAEERLATGLTRDDKKKIFRDNLARLERKQGSA
jgi:F-type H+-transporting ATPase subunit b